MRTYALVGGMGAGKSTVARRLARRFGGVRVDADRLGHRVLRLARVRRRLLEAFGPDIVPPGGDVDRRRLGARVFGHRARLERLNGIVHPEIAHALARRLARERQRGTPFVLLDAALYFEFDPRPPVNGVLAVVAPRAVRRERLRRRTGLQGAALDARLASQPRLASWIRRADVVLDTDCPRPLLEARIDTAWKALRRMAARRGRVRRGQTDRSRRAGGTARSSQGVSLMSRSSGRSSKRSNAVRRRPTSGTTRPRRATRSQR